MTAEAVAELRENLKSQIDTMDEYQLRFILSLVKKLFPLD